MILKNIPKEIQQDFERVDALIQSHLHTTVPLAQTILQYVLSAGGKRIRPLLVLSSAHAFAYQGTDHIVMAVIIELLHNATLLHDDVIDQSPLRRGRRTANHVWGNAASILVGDLLHARCFELIATLKHPNINQVLAQATSVIAEGELRQLTHCHDLTTTEDDYFEIIAAKTGKLFEVATHAGAVVSHRNAKECEAMANYGRCLGIAFQLMDDILDYMGVEQTIGKCLGEDLAEGKPSLALIYVLKYGNETQQARIRTVLTQDQSPIAFEAIREVIIQSGAIDYIQEQATRYATQAKSHLVYMPASGARDTLLQLTDFAIQRTQ